MNDPWKGYFAELPQLLNRAAGRFNRNGKRKPDGPPTGTQYPGIDTDNLSIKVQQRSPGITRIDRYVRLDERHVLLGVGATPGSTDDTGGHGLFEIEG